MTYICFNQIQASLNTDLLDADNYSTEQLFKMLEHYPNIKGPEPNWHINNYINSETIFMQCNTRFY